MDETIKELALIDGAFMQGMVWWSRQVALFKANQTKSNCREVWVRGTQLQLALPSQPDSLALVVSSSGQVTYFSKGSDVYFIGKV